MSQGDFRCRVVLCCLVLFGCLCLVTGLLFSETEIVNRLLEKNDVGRIFLKGRTFSKRRKSNDTFVKENSSSVSRTIATSLETSSSPSVSTAAISHETKEKKVIRHETKHNVEMKIVLNSITKACGKRHGNVETPDTLTGFSYKRKRFRHPINRSAMRMLDPEALVQVSKCFNSSRRVTLQYPPLDGIPGMDTHTKTRIAILVSGEFRLFGMVNKSLSTFQFSAQPNSDAFLNVRLLDSTKFEKGKHICKAWRMNGGFTNCRYVEERFVNVELRCFQKRFERLNLRARMGGHAHGGEPPHVRFVGQMYALWGVYTLFRDWEAQHPDITYTTLVRVRSDGFLGYPLYMSNGAFTGNYKPYPFDIQSLSDKMNECDGILTLRKDNHAIVPRKFGDCFFGRFQLMLTRSGLTFFDDLLRAVVMGSPEHFAFAVAEACNMIVISPPVIDPHPGRPTGATKLAQRFPAHFNGKPRDVRRQLDDRNFIEGPWSQ